MDLEGLLNDDLADFVPPHLRVEGVDTALINALITHVGNSEIYERLYRRMNSATESAYHSTVEWHLGVEKDERYAAARLELYVERQRIQEIVQRIFPHGIGERIDREYTLFLLQQGLPAHKINWWRKFLAGRYGNMLQLFGENVYAEKPHGLASWLAYHAARKVRSMMLEGASPLQDYDAGTPR